MGKSAWTYDEVELLLKVTHAYKAFNAAENTTDAVCFLSEKVHVMGRDKGKDTL